MTMDKYQVCTRDGFAEGLLMLMPPKLNWFKARDLCRRFDGRLHIDNSHQSIVSKVMPLIANGESVNPDRCERIWLGASDKEEENVWRDSETNEVLDLSSFWAKFQPNGARVENCVGIFQTVIEKNL